MSDLNPYTASPVAETQTPLAGGDFPLATLGQRFLGNFIDTLLLLPLVFICFFALMIAYSTLIDPTYLQTDSLEPRNFGEFLAETAMTLLSLSASFLILNGYLIANRGQTIGKYLLGTQMVGEDGQLVSLLRIFFNRYAIFFVMAYIPIVSIVCLIDPLAIFGERRMCLHDRVARTRVISIR